MTTSQAHQASIQNSLSLFSMSLLCNKVISYEYYCSVSVMGIAYVLKFTAGSVPQAVSKDYGEQMLWEILDDVILLVTELHEVIHLAFVVVFLYAICKDGSVSIYCFRCGVLFRHILFQVY